MKILVTGGSGQLARTIVDVLGADEEFSIVALSRDDCDIVDRAAVEGALREHSPDAVVNAAAYTNVDAAETAEEAARRINAHGAENVARASADLDLPIVHISTDYVFDGTQSTPYRESDATGPRSAYGRTKLEGENLVREANPKHFVIRTAWLYSTHGQNFPKTMLALSEKHEELRVVDDQRGSPTYAADLASAIGVLLRTNDWGICHIAGSGAATWYELTKKLFELRDVSTPVHPVTTDEFPRPAPRPANSVLVSERANAIILPPWEEGLADFAAALE